MNLSMKITACLIIFTVTRAESNEYQLSEQGFPDKVDLSYQFRKETKCQIGGTCHIFAATALMEGACYRATGKKIDISEAYFMYHHWRDVIKSSRYDLSELYPADTNAVDAENTRNMIFYFDGGYPIETISRALSKSICTENEFPLEKEFLKKISHHNKILNKIVADEIQKKSKIFGEKVGKAVAVAFTEKSTKEYYCDKLDNTALCFIPPSTVKKKSKEKGIIATSNDPDLRACFKKKPKVVNLEDPKEEVLLKLLRNKIPFVCSTFVSYGDGKSGAHALVVTGYEMIEGERIYLARDSNGYGDISQWMGMNCSLGLQYITTDGEKDPLQK